MKIHRVRLRNLNSLYGEHEVDFAGDLGEAPLFLIVGPTGAGKSTVMDAISLALFGSTPRLDGRDAEDPRMVMSRGTGRCEAEVVFSKQAPGQPRRYYRARWECWRARDTPDGALQVPRRSLEEVADATGAEPQVRVADQRAKFYGPEFDAVLEGMAPAEFQRSMLLAQGEFAAFLKATVDDRAAILERLTNTQQYRRIGARAKQRWQDARDAADRLRAQVDAIALLTAVELEALHEDAAAAEQELVAVRSRAARASARLAWVSRLGELREGHRAAAARAAAAEESWEHDAPVRERLAESERCAGAGELRRRVREATARLRRTRAEAEEARAALAAAEAAAVGAASRADEASAGLATAVLQVAELTGVPVDPEGPDRGVAAVRRSLDAERERLSAGRSGIVRARDRGIRLAADRARAESLVEVLASFVGSVERAKADAEAASREVATADELGAAHAAILEKHEFVVGLADRRAALIDGEPCPLCGSTEHPLAGDDDAEEQARQHVATARRGIEAAKERAAAARAAQTAAVRALAGAESGLERTRSERDALLARITEDTAALESDLADLDAAARSDLGGALERIEDRQRELRDAVDALDRESTAWAAAESGLVQARGKLETARSLAMERDARVERETGEVAALESDLAAALVELGISDVETLDARVLAPAERERLAAKTSALATERDEARGRAHGLAEQLAAHEKARPEDLPDDVPSVEALEQESRDAESALRLAEERRADLLARMRRHDADVERRQGLLATFDAAEQEVALWDEMRKLIGTADGGAFQKFAQTLNLAELIANANVRLRELEPRYSLVVARDAEGQPVLEFAVMDHEHADVVRPQTTLSGGETFLVSLALALALADYRQTQMPIETLLLDEGFGTLDTETLDVAMSALERLCAIGGTQIGVISHVESLRERIDAQIVVEKLGAGRSRLRVRA